MIKFHHAFGAIAVVLLFHVLALGMDWYRALGWFDVPMHFFGGYAMGLLALAIFAWIMTQIELRSRSVKTSPYVQVLLEGVFILGFVMMIGVAWEWYELCFDQFATSFVAKFGVAQMGLLDTMDDLFNDGIGGIVAWVSWRNRE